jgi:hypothetical protein
MKSRIKYMRRMGQKTGRSNASKQVQKKAIKKARVEKNL